MAALKRQEDAMNPTTTWEHSESVGELAKALAEAQQKIHPAVFDSTNPHFKSRFASLASIAEAARPLAAHGLAYAQLPYTDGDLVGVRSVLLHSSGQWLACSVACKPQQAGPQALGSVLTYLRRYSLSAIAGIVADDDDDAEAAEPRPAPKAAPKAAPKQPRWQTVAAQLQNVYPGADAATLQAAIAEAVGRPSRLKELTDEEFDKLEAAIEERAERLAIQLIDGGRAA